VILTIDIGNTTIGLAALKNGKVKDVQHIDTVSDPKELSAALDIVLKKFDRNGFEFKKVAICSVVPKASVSLERILKKRGFTVVLIGKDIKVPMANKYRNPSQVGQDRLVGAYAAMHLYGKPLIVVDLGTAITFDVVSARGEYLGGAIVPGIRLSAESLFLKTALLPQIDIKAPKSVIGQTTQESILSGLFYGYGSLCQGFIELISRQIKSKPRVVMTGGHTKLMKKFVSPKIRITDEHLVYKGIALLLES
jgi:type III pantothenate kinase